MDLTRSRRRRGAAVFVVGLALVATHVVTADADLGEATYLIVVIAAAIAAWTAALRRPRRRTTMLIALGVSLSSAGELGALLDLGRTLQLETVAEGVELGVQRDSLRDENCGFAQGYLFARPLDDQDAEILLMQLEGAWTAGTS